MGNLRQPPIWRTIRGRVTVVLAVPTCLLLALTGAGVADRAGDWFAARDTAHRVEVVLDVQALVRELQRERGLTSGLLGGADDYRAELDATRDRTDTARRKLDSTELAAADTELSRLLAVRNRVDEGTIERGDSLRFYTDAIITLNESQPTDAQAHALGDTRLGDALDALRALADATEALALERGSMNGVFAAGRFKGTEYLDFTEVRAARFAALRQYEESATGSQQGALDAAFATRAAERAADYEEQAAGGADGSPLTVDPAKWWASMTVLVDDLHDVQRGIGGDIRARAGRLSQDATHQLAGFLALGMLILVIASTLAWLAARSITRPLGALAREADTVAGKRLPDTVRAAQQSDPKTVGQLTPTTPRLHLHTTAEEISQLATALHNVERTAVELATEQAALRRNSTEALANLGHRNQRLLRRQLSLITTLESQELDPDALAELFELDHLATRMRRNADSLLVLTGEASPSRVWSGTVPVAEVIQSAISEVEDYCRVAVADAAPCRIHGHAVADLSHILAELIENALTATPPTQPVQVHGWWDGPEYCLAVIDHGTGMTASDLTRANARLTGKENFLAAPTRFLGHYVVGKLATRLGAQVELRHTHPTTTGTTATGTGISAYAALPPHILAPEADAVPTQQPRVPAGVT